MGSEHNGIETLDRQASILNLLISYSDTFHNTQERGGDGCGSYLICPSNAMKTAKDSFINRIRLRHQIRLKNTRGIFQYSTNGWILQGKDSTREIWGTVKERKQD